MEDFKPATKQLRQKLYIGCSLTHAPQQFRDDIESLKQFLREQYEVFDFLGLTAGSALDVYRWDIQHCVAICDHTSLGLGYELGTAIEKYHKPVLAVAHHDTRLSRLVIGIDAPGYSLERYDHIADIAALIETKLASV
jgi:hypothetical protein